MRSCLTVFILLFTTIPLWAKCVQEAGYIAIREISTPEVVVFCNKTQQTILLERSVTQEAPGASAGWSSMLPHFGCSVFLTDHAPFVFHCRLLSAHGNKTAPVVDCSRYVRASCFRWSGGMRCGHTPSGSYWLAEGVFAADLAALLRRQCFDV